MFSRRVPPSRVRYSPIRHSLHRGRFDRLCSDRTALSLSPSLLPPALTVRLPLHVTVVAATPRRRLRASTISTVLSRYLYRVALSRAHVYRRIHGHGRRLVRQGGRQQFLTKKPESPSPPSLSPFLPHSSSLFLSRSSSAPPVSPRTRVRLTATVIGARHRDGG